MPESTDFTSKDVLKSLFVSHTKLIDYYKKNRNRYLGNQDIFSQAAKAAGKPDNKLCVNYLKYITDMECGYFAGNPWKYNIKDENIAKTFEGIKDNNELVNVDFNHTKNCSIYGHSFELQFIDISGNYRIIDLLPENVIIIYSDTVEKSRLCSIYYANKLDKDNKVYQEGTIYTKETIIQFKNIDNDISIIDEQFNNIGKVPIIEYKQNEYRTSVFDDIVSLTDGYNKALSEKLNDVEYFADAYLLMAGIELDEGTTADSIRDKKMIYAKELSERYDIRFLEKPNADGTQENLLDRLKKEIFTIAGVPDMTAEDFGNASGKSLKYRMFALENNRTQKEAQFRSALRQRFKALFNWLGKLNNQALTGDMVEFQFYTNIPADIDTEILNAKNLSGIVSQETQLKALTIVDNVAEEINKMKAEKETSTTDPFGGE